MKTALSVLSVLVCTAMASMPYGYGMSRVGIFGKTGQGFGNYNNRFGHGFGRVGVNGNGVGFGSGLVGRHGSILGSHGLARHGPLVMSHGLTGHGSYVGRQGLFGYGPVVGSHGLSGNNAFLGLGVLGRGLSAFTSSLGVVRTEVGAHGIVGSQYYH